MTDMTDERQEPQEPQEPDDHDLLIAEATRWANEKGWRTTESMSVSCRASIVTSSGRVVGAEGRVTCYTERGGVLWEAGPFQVYY